MSPLQFCKQDIASKVEVLLHSPMAISTSYPRPFGNYLLLRQLGVGGMGAVHLAKREGFDDIAQLCVLKTIKHEVRGNEVVRGRFVDEARVVVQLNHRNICHVSDVGSVGDEYFFAMEYIVGKTLAEVYNRQRKRKKPLPPEIALYFICEMLEALDYAHRLKHPLTGEALNVVHRDVSPHNVMVNHEGELKLIDFGLATSTLKNEHTAPNTVVGKLMYLAPEQASDEPITPATDIYATGIMLYELLTGARYYEGLERHEVISKVLRGHTPIRMQSIAQPLAKVIIKATRIDAKRRWTSAAQMREAILEHVHQEGLRLESSLVRLLMERDFGDELPALRRQIRESLELIDQNQPDATRPALKAPEKTAIDVAPKFDPHVEATTKNAPALNENLADNTIKNVRQPGFNNDLSAAEATQETPIPISMMPTRAPSDALHSPQEPGQKRGLVIALALISLLALTFIAFVVLAGDSESSTLDLKQTKPSGQSALEKQATEKQAAEKLAAEKLAAEKQAAEKQAAEKQAAEKQAAEKQAAEKQAAEKLALEKQALQKKRSSQNTASRKVTKRKAAERKAAERKASERLVKKPLAEPANMGLSALDSHLKKYCKKVVSCAKTNFIANWKYAINNGGDQSAPHENALKCWKRCKSKY